MHTEHQFADLAESLKKGLIADQIVLALARVEKRHEVSNADRDVFAAAVTILDLVKEGHGWLDSLKLTSQTRLGANYFGQAVEALPQVKSSEMFVKNIDTLKKIARELASADNIPSNPELKELREFFFNASQIESDRTDQLLSGENDSKQQSWLRKDE